MSNTSDIAHLDETGLFQTGEHPVRINIIQTPEREREREREREQRQIDREKDRTERQSR